MKLVIMHGQGDRDVKISFGMRKLVAISCVVFTGAMVLGAVLQQAIWFSFPETMPAAFSSDASAAKPLTHEAVKALASRVGELQANLIKLEALSRRVAKNAGLPEDRVAITKDLPEATVVLDEMLAPTEAESDRQPVSALERQINLIQAELDAQSDFFSLLDLDLTRQKASIAHVPTAMPLDAYPFLSSSYGWRRHPFSGRISMHEGLDFSAPTGTPIKAAAGGVVKTVSMHSGYGNMVEIEHGDGLLTRYAHAQVVVVMTGQLVTRGQVIARVGSTGLSTGPHLHFEVRKHDRAVDPRIFLSGQPFLGEIVRTPAAATPPGVTWRARLR